MIMDDFSFQRDFIAAAAWRLLGMQDRNACAPSHGCFHYAYWRDKTSEFPDVRFQEAGATLGLLSLPRFDLVREEQNAPSADELYQGYSAGLKNWAAQQHSDGSFDEWYKGERGFAATGFPMIAYGLAAKFMGDRLTERDRQLHDRTMQRSANWLLKRHDLVKANHEAAAAAALALAWDKTGDESFRSGAREKMLNALARQHPEGWFPEVGGMDLGYCSVLLDYLMIYVHVTGDEDPVPAARKLFGFMHPLIHPDLTISPEMGLCLNPYVARVGVGLLSSYDDRAQSMVAAFRTVSPGQMGLAPYLGDDLRLARWSHLPLVAELLGDSFNADGHDEKTLHRNIPDGWTFFSSSGVGAYHADGVDVYFMPVGGGTVRLFVDNKLIYEDAGFTIEESGNHWVCQGYNPGREVKIGKNEITMLANFGRAVFFYPSFVSRLVLRAACVTPATSRWIRALIDLYRLRKGTAINQSAAPIVGKNSPFKLTRKVRTEGGCVEIEDTVHIHPAKIGKVRVQNEIVSHSQPMSAFSSLAEGKSIIISKIVHPRGEVEIRDLSGHASKDSRLGYAT